MTTKRCTRAACAVLLTSLAGCGHRPHLPPPEPVEYSAWQAQAVPQSGTYYQYTRQRRGFDSVDAYKDRVAAQIMRHNADYTFSGRLPPMLPAIVVLSITVDRDGRISRMAVQRSRDDDASQVALASMERTGWLPRPVNLANGPGGSLTFSETFLFNEDYRFQLRTLAPVQYAD